MGFVEIDRAEIADQRADMLAVFSPAKTLVNFVCRMNRENICTPVRSVANVEFHDTCEEVNEITRKIVASLEQRGVRPINPAMGFPMEVDRWPGVTFLRGSPLFA